MVAKPTTPNGRDNFGHTQLDQGMNLELEPSLTMTYEQERGVDSALRAFAQGRGLVLQGQFPFYQVRATRGALSASDQVTLVDGLIDRPGLAAMALTWSLAAEGSGRGLASEARVRISISDMGLIGLTLLHRTQRISPARYLEVLAEFETSQEGASVPAEPSWLGAPAVGAMH